MARFFLVLLFVVAGYVVSAVVGYFLVNAMSSNTSDRSLEAAMTAAFVLGPAGAVVAGIVGFFRTGAA